MNLSGLWPHQGPGLPPRGRAVGSAALDPQPVDCANCLAHRLLSSPLPDSPTNESSLHGHLFVLVSDRLMLLMAHNHFSEVI
jgi:hypothetical protein